MAGPNWVNILMQVDEAKGKKKVYDRVKKDIEALTEVPVRFPITVDGKVIEAKVLCKPSFSGDLKNPVRITCSKPKPEGSDAAFDKRILEAMRKQFKVFSAELRGSRGGAAASSSGGSTRKRKPCPEGMKRSRKSGRCVKK